MSELVSRGSRSPALAAATVVLVDPGSGLEVPFQDLAGHRALEAVFLASTAEDPTHAYRSCSF